MDTKHHDATRASHFANLPHEILDHICSFICHGCSTYERGFCLTSYSCDTRLATRTLASLCLSFRNITTVAQAHLYHYITALPLDNLDLHNFVTVGLQNPQLAGKIEAFYAPGLDELRSFKGWSTPKLLALAAEVGVTGDITPVGSRIDEREQVSNIFAQLVMIFATRLRRLRLSVSENPNEDACDYRLLPSRLESAAKVASCNDDDDHGISREQEREEVARPLSQLRVLHLIPHYRCWGVRLHTPTISVLLGGPAATLEHLVLNYCTGLWYERHDSEHNVDNMDDTSSGLSRKGINMPNLKSLALNNCAIAADDHSTLAFLSQICQSAAHLEEVHFIARAETLKHVIGQSHATPFQLFEHLVLPCRETLKVLTVDLVEWAMGLTDKPGLPAGAFAEFPRLEELVVEDTSFCQVRHRHGEAATTTEATGRVPNTCLTSLLPSSIKRLVVHVHGGAHVWGDLRELAYNLERFGNLKSLTVFASLLTSRRGSLPFLEYADFNAKVQETEELFCDAMQVHGSAQVTIKVKKWMPGMRTSEAVKKSWEH